MNPPNSACPKCAADMEPGLLIDATNRAVTTWPLRMREQVLEWVRGFPDKSWLDLSFKAGPDDRLQVVTMRCTACGYLEAYAPQARS